MSPSSLSTGFNSGSESFDSVSNSADSDFTETYNDSISPINDHSFISSLVSHCVSIGSAKSPDLSSITEGIEGQITGSEEQSLESFSESKKSENRKKSEIVIVPELNSDFGNLGASEESCLPLSVDFSDTESECEPSSLTDFVRDDSEDRKKKESFVSEIEFRPKSEFLLEISATRDQYYKPNLAVIQLL